MIVELRFVVDPHKTAPTLPRPHPPTAGLCQEQIARHLTAKSVGRVENVFSFFGSPETLTKLYTEPEYKELLEQLNTGLTVIVDKL